MQHNFKDAIRFNNEALFIAEDIKDYDQKSLVKIF